MERWTVTATVPCHSAQSLGPAPVTAPPPPNLPRLLPNPLMVAYQHGALLCKTTGIGHFPVYLPPYFWAAGAVGTKKEFCDFAETTIRTVMRLLCSHAQISWCSWHEMMGHQLIGHGKLHSDLIRVLIVVSATAQTFLVPSAGSNGRTYHWHKMIIC